LNKRTIEIDFILLWLYEGELFYFFFKSIFMTAKTLNDMDKLSDIDQVRERIDTLDNSIHDLLMERATLVQKIGEQKRKNNLEIVQPAREARLLRRLLARHNAPLQKETFLRMWRELIGGLTLLQKEFSVSVTVPEGTAGPSYWDMARDYFGSVVPAQKTSSPFSALGAVRDDSVLFAVLPYPEVDEETPWWQALMDEGTEKIRIVQSLPYSEKGKSAYGHRRALVTGKATFHSSDHDHSFIAFSVSANISRAKLTDVTKALGLEPLSLYTQVNSIPDAPSLHLLEVNDYVSENDERLQLFLEKLEDPKGTALCVGGYPAPLE
jgi:chorismate mutase/prephenate dehydratase